MFPCGWLPPRANVMSVHASALAVTCRRRRAMGPVARVAFARCERLGAWHEQPRRRWL